MPNIKIKPCPYAVIISASFWLKRQESVWLLNMTPTCLRVQNSLGALPGGHSPGGRDISVWPRRWALFVVLKGNSRGTDTALATANCTRRLHLNDIKQTFKHICSRDTALKRTVPWHKCADLKLADVYSWITLGWLYAIATFCSNKDTGLFFLVDDWLNNVTTWTHTSTINTVDFLHT